MELDPEKKIWKGRLGVYPLCFLKSEEVVCFVMVGGAWKTSVWRWLISLELGECVIRKFCVWKG